MDCWYFNYYYRLKLEYESIAQIEREQNEFIEDFGWLITVRFNIVIVLI
jgi:hypothetical protein